MLRYPLAPVKRQADGQKGTMEKEPMLAAKRTWYRAKTKGPKKRNVYGGVSSAGQEGGTSRPFPSMGIGHAE